MSRIDRKTNYYFNLIPLIIVSFFIFKITNNPTSVRTFIKIISPFFWAVLIAYIFNPLMIYLENNFKIKRLWSILLIYLILLGLLTLVIAIITPKIIESISRILVDFPDYIIKTQKWISFQMDKLEYLGRYNTANYIESIINNSIEQLNNSIRPILNKTVQGAFNITSAIFNFILGIIISAYFLMDKEAFVKQYKRIAYALLSANKADNIIRITTEFNVVFSKYLVGKIIDSLIIGILCFIGLLFIKAPYTLLLSTIVGVTNLIPYFGPLIGMIPAVIVTLFYSPIKSLWVFLFILALQQFDGLYLGPKILGTKVGLSPLWVISAIIIGGGLFGILGMLLAVPIAAIIKVIIEKFINTRLDDKKIKI